MGNNGGLVVQLIGGHNKASSRPISQTIGFQGVMPES